MTAHSLLFVVIWLLVGLAAFVWRSRPHHGINVSFALFTSAVALWAAGIAVVLHEGPPEVWGRIAFAGASLIPALFLVFVAHYPSTINHATAIICSAVVIGGSFAFLSCATPLIVEKHSMLGTVMTRVPGPLYPVFASYFIVTWLAGLILLSFRMHHARGVARSQLQYLCVTLALSSAVPIVSNLVLPWLGGTSQHSWIGPYFALLYVALMTHAIIRHRFMDLRLIVHKGLILSLALIFSLTPVGIAIAIFWPHVFTVLRHDQLVVSAAAVVVVALLIPTTRHIAEQLLDRYVYRGQADYKAMVGQISRALTRVIELKGLLNFISGRLLDWMKSEGVAIYVFEGCHRVVRSPVGLQTTFSAPDFPCVIRDELQRTKDGIVADDLGRRAHRAQSPGLRALLTELNWALVLPLLSDDTVIGAIALGPKLSGDPYYPQDLELLATLANQAGIAVKNAQLYAEVVLANEYVENIVATINSGVVAVSAAGRITLFNRAAEHLTGLAASEVRLEPTSVLPACLGAPLARTIAEGRPITSPEIILPDGTGSRPVLCTVSPLRDTEGSILGGVAVFSDLTPLKELQVERARAEKLDYFKLLASGFAHEIKNPLVSIKTFVQLVPLRLDDRRWLEEFSRVVHREIERIERLLQRLASLGSAHQRPQSSVDLRRPVREAVELLRPEFAERRIGVDARLGGENTSILGDHDELKQLAHNLLLNALQHTPVGGSVTVEVSVRDNRPVLTVLDTGPGIAPAMLESIFDPFVTTRSHGTGLGLAICAGIATAHRARLQAANRAGGGASFTVEFPLVTSVPAAVSA